MARLNCLQHHAELDIEELLSQLNDLTAKVEGKEKVLVWKQLLGQELPKFQQIFPCGKRGYEEYSPLISLGSYQAAI